MKEFLDKNNIENFIPMRYEYVTRKEQRIRKLVPAIHNLVFIYSTRKKIAEIKEHADNTQQIAEMVNELQDKTENVIKNLEDFLHTDNEKVYRNVQASMVEELDRRTGELKDELQKTQ